MVRQHWLLGAGGGLEGEDIRGTGDGDDAVDGAEVRREGAVVRRGTEDELREALDSVGRF